MSEMKIQVITKANKKRTDPPDIQLCSKAYKNNQKSSFLPEHIPNTNDSIATTAPHRTYHK